MFFRQLAGRRMPDAPSNSATLPGILAVTKAIAAQRERRLDVKPLQDYF